jgi:hypothetical protein
VINSCITTFYIPAFLLLAASAPAAQERADDLYRDRATFGNAQRAAQIWAARIAAAPGDFDAAWKLSRAQYWLGTNGLPPHERKSALEAGIAAARLAVAAQAARPEGHFWLAANMGALAESFGLRQGLKYRGAIRDALETVLRLDAAFQQGSADRALGRWYYKVPRLFGGDRKKSEAHLRRALTYNPQSVITRVFLAETLIDMNRKAEARQELQLAIAAPEDPEWAPEDRVFREQAKALLSRLR